MKELFVEKALKFYIRFLKVNKQKFWALRIFLGLGLFLVLTLAFIKTQNVWFVITSPVLGYVGYKIPYWQIVSRKNHVDIVNSFLFPEFLRSFISLLGTQGNVFQTLKATVPYLEEPLKSEVARLVEKITEKNDREYYLELADYVGSNEAYLIMSMIYEFSLVGTNKDMLDELERYIEEIQNNKVRELKRYKVLKMERHSNLPLVSTVIFMLIFTLSCMYYFTSNLGNF